MKAAAVRTARAPRRPAAVAARPARRGTEPSMLLRTMRGLLVRRMTALLALLMLLAMVKVWIGLQVVATGYELSDLRKEQLRLEEFRQQLEIELATRRSRGALEEQAHRRLGLGTPARGQVVDVR